ncbi:CNH domain-containing protein [Schizophyllum amplum]|uniref:CNH domain-containing protein n=1 Tax=Schizophyllum amplum TaxID=97359 RepID=A0A550C1U7_9AGAR|nr:CNH domain-containing protein [Auriculariopsis ampla]
MSTAAKGRSRAPLDRDLQRLYDEVWAGFAEEAPAPDPSWSSSIDKDLDNVYNLYAGQGSPDPGSAATLSYTPSPPPPPPSQSPPYAARPSSSPRSSNTRRLPPTPLMSMPEPELHQDPPRAYTQGSQSSVSSSSGSYRPNMSSSESYPSSSTSYNSSYSSKSSDLRHTTSAKGRRLPPTPRPTTADGSRQHVSGSRTPTRPGTSPGPASPTVAKGRSNGTSYDDKYNGRTRDYEPSGYDDGRTNGYDDRRAAFHRQPPPPKPAVTVQDTEPMDRSKSYGYRADEPAVSGHARYGRAASNSLEVPGGKVGLPRSPSPNTDQRFYRHRAESSVSVQPAAEVLNSYAGVERTPSACSQVDYVVSSPPWQAPSAPYDPYSESASTHSVAREDTSYIMPSPEPAPASYSDHTTYETDAAAGGLVVRRPSEMLRDLAREDGADHYDDLQEEYWEDEDEDDESRFVNYSLLSHLAVQLRDKVPRGTHVKGSIPYPSAFTGKDIVSTIQAQIQRELVIVHGISTNDRRAALKVARSLQSQLFFYEVEWGSRILQDGVEDVYMFMDDLDGASEGREREELPTGLVTMLARCYTPGCGETEGPCYAYSCPRKGGIVALLEDTVEAPVEPVERDWIGGLAPELLDNLPESERNRQTIIHKVIAKEETYLQDLDIVESAFIKPLRNANPPVIASDMLEDFIDDVFHNILDLRECNRRLLEVLHVRQREQTPVIQYVGDIFLVAAAEFELAYPIYIGHHPMAEKRLKDETDNNPELRLFLEQCARNCARGEDQARLDLKHFLNRPSEHLQKYPVLLEAIQNETTEGNADADYLKNAIDALKNLQSAAQLRTFQSAMGKGTPGKWEWHDLVSTEYRLRLHKDEQKRQATSAWSVPSSICLSYHINHTSQMYIEPLRAADPPIIAPHRLNQFIIDVFHNYAELYEHHRKFLDALHAVQLQQHPEIRSVTALMFDAVLNFREAYIEYIPNYPVAAYRIDDEMANNLAFKTFVEQCIRHPDAHRLDMKNFINRPIPRLLRYELLLKNVLEETPPGHEDRDEIPSVLDLIKALGKETEPGVVSAKQKVELWRYHSNLVFKPGELVDMDLLADNRVLIHSGKLLRQPDTGFEFNGWPDMFVLLFDNYLVMTKPKERDGITKYNVYRRPIPLDLLTLVNLNDPPTQRGTGLLRNLRGGHENSPSVPSPESAGDSRMAYPCTIHHNGRLGGPYILYAESAAARNEWKQKLEEALGIRKVVQESNKVFEVETLSADTFLVPSVLAGPSSPSYNQDSALRADDGRGLVAIGCAEEFGIFLVLADKSLFAYHIEALAPQKLNGAGAVQFFCVGKQQGRTLVIYMKKKGLESIFRVLEPVADKIGERTRAATGLGHRLFKSAKSEWFRVYKDFFLPSEAYDVVFLKATIVIMCSKGFEIMNIDNYQSVSIPLREDPRVEKVIKRSEACRPLGMFRSGDNEFLLCYDEFGFYVDKHGDPSRAIETIEWEGTAQSVAFHPPYVLLFDSRFIEIRHVETARLCQIITGNDVRCIWDGRGSGDLANQLRETKVDEDNDQEARVHAVMNSTEAVAGGRGARAVAQHVFELIPTVALTLPEPAPNTIPGHSPNTSYAYMQRSSSSSSPPISPTNMRSTSWRS